jgi:TRAP-type C4-dicarboxylate transport system permease small subunit
VTLAFERAIEPNGATLAAERTIVRRPLLAALQRALGLVNRVIALVASLALVGASLVLSYSVVVRYAFHEATYWQDEAAVFLIVGATFLAAAYVQERRGHVGIEAIVGLLSARVNWVRLLAVDLASLAFCGFFSWKSWTLFHEAYVDGQVTSSTWGPPLAIPYGVMAAGMTLLSLQILLQLAAFLAGGQTAPKPIPLEDRH